MSGDIIRVFDAAKAGCNTTRDVADVTGMSIEVSAAWVSKLLAYGALVRTGRKIKPAGRGRPAQCFQIAPAFASVALIFVAVMVSQPAHAKPWACVLFPKQCIEPTAAPEPAPPPPAAAPLPSPAPEAKAKAKPLPRVIRPKYKPAPAKARHAVVAMPSWWSCKKAREKVAGKSRSEIAALQAWGRTFGYTLSKEQETAAKRCLGFS